MFRRVVSTSVAISLAIVVSTLVKSADKVLRANVNPVPSKKEAVERFAPFTIDALIVDTLIVVESNVVIVPVSLIKSKQSNTPSTSKSLDTEALITSKNVAFIEALTFTF